MSYLYHRTALQLNSSNDFGPDWGLSRSLSRHLLFSNPTLHRHACDLSCYGRRIEGSRKSVKVTRASPQPGLLTGLLEAIQAEFLQQSKQSSPPLSSLCINALTYHPPGAEAPLLQGVNMFLPAGTMGLVYGQSGAGKTTLLQMVAGLAKPTSGGITIDQTGTKSSATPLSTSQLSARAGMVFQFPERHFLGSTIYDEVTFGWPADPWQRQAASLQLPEILRAVDLDQISVRTPLRQLSDGYKRRVALAVQIARRPSLLLLDEPLAGLDWRSRADVARVLGNLKQQCTVLAVSHDLRELTELVDQAWQMVPGGILKSSQWPPETI